MWPEHDQGVGLLRLYTVPRMGDADAARGLRREIEAAGGEIYLAGAELRDHFERTRLTVKAKGEIGSALRAARISSDPSLTTVQAGDEIRLSVAGRKSPAAEEPTTSASGAAGAFGDAATGAFVVGGIATVIAFAGWWVYGLILGLATLLVFVVLRGRWFRISLFPRLPSWLSVPWKPGALAMLAVALLVSLVAVLPIANSRDDGRRVSATNSSDGPAPAAGTDTNRLEEDRDRSRRAEAERLFQTGRSREAIELAERLGDDELAADFQGRAARNLREKARDELDFGSPGRAIRLAGQSQDFKETQAARDIQSAARRSERDLEAEESDPPPSQSVPESESEPEPPPELDLPSGSPGCLPQSACPGRRDGDGDGCFCE